MDACIETVNRASGNCESLLSVVHSIWNHAHSHLPEC